MAPLAHVSTGRAAARGASAASASKAATPSGLAHVYATGRPQRRCAAAASQVQDAPQAAWSFTRSDSFQSIRQPHRLQAQLLERAVRDQPVIEVPASRDEAIVLMERLQQETATQGSADGLNVVPFTGGSGPALTAYLLASVFDGAVLACIGDTAAMPPVQAEHARFTADLLGIELVEVDAAFWAAVQLPAALAADADSLCVSLAGAPCRQARMTVFCGATADDVTDFGGGGGGRRRGLCAPLAGLSCAAVNALTRAVGLPEWTAGEPQEAALAAN